MFSKKLESDLTISCTILSYFTRLPSMISVSTPDITCRLTFEGSTYKGYINVSASGLPCQLWDSQLPHWHVNNDISNFPDDTMDEASNNCRNPDGSYTPWCYTTTSVRYDFCAVPMCESKCNEHGPLTRYVNLRVAHAPGMPGTVSPSPRVSDPDMHQGTCVTHVL